MLPPPSKCREGGLVAWTQCVSITNVSCEVSEYWSRETDKCMSRALELEGKKRVEVERRIKALKEVAGRASKAKARFDLASGAINDPRKFVATAALGGNKEIMNALSPGLSTSARNSLVEQAYLHAYRRAQAGISMTADPGVKGIQESSLRRIDALYGQIFKDMDLALTAMTNFRGDSPSETPSGSKPPARSKPRSDGEKDESSDGVGL